MRRDLGCGPNLKIKIARFGAEIAFQTPGRYGREIAAQRKTAQRRNRPAVLDVAEKGGRHFAHLQRAEYTEIKL